MNPLPSCIDYITAIENPRLLRAQELNGGCVITKNGKPLRYAGGFCVVFPYQLANGKKVAIRCWTAHVTDADKRSNQISIQLQNNKLPYFVEFKYIPHGIATPIGVFPIVLMDWVDALPLKDYIKNHINDNKSLIELANNFLQMTKDLHKVGFSHGDLQHGNIMIAPDGHLYLVDYDSMFVPGLENVLDEIKGLPGYQHPKRKSQKYLSPFSDYFSELIIYTSILAIAIFPYLWEKLEIEDTETLIFKQEDLDNPHRSYIFTKLKSEPSLLPCAEAIENALKESNIEKLLPLEKAIIPTSTKITEGLQEKWKHRYVPTNNVDTPIIDKILLKWKQSTSESNNEIVDVSPITAKWK